MTESTRAGVLLRLSWLVTSICAPVSTIFMLMVGRRQKSILLIAMFGLWVGSSFFALAYAQLSKAFRGAAASWAAIVISLGSTAMYADVALGPPQPQPAKFFLLVPAASWLVLIAVLLSARLASRTK